MTLEEMGALLRQERERQGIPLEKIAGDIKISKKYLVALEEGRKEGLPHPVYAKGFIKNYARILGLDPQEMANILAQHYDVDDDQLREAPRYDAKESAPSIREKRISFASGSSSRRFQPSLWLALPLALVFAGVIWFFFSSGAGTSFESLSTIFSSRDDGPKPVASQLPAKPTPKAESKPESPHGDSVTPAPGEMSAASQILGGKTASQPASASPPAPSLLSPQVSDQALTPANLDNEAQFASVGSQGVEINANQPAKLEVTDEAGQNRAFTLLKGQRLTLKFNTRIGVRFVSAPSVALKLNGKDYPLEGGKAEGRSIQFP